MPETTAKYSAPATSSASTDVQTLLGDLDGGVFERLLSTALSQCAAAAVDNEKAAKVTVTFDMSPIKKSQQVQMTHKLVFSKPTTTGKSSEETSSETVVYVGRFGALSVTPPAQLDLFKNP